MMLAMQRLDRAITGGIMSRNKFTFHVAGVIVVYMLAIALGIWLRSLDPSDRNTYYNTFKYPIPYRVASCLSCAPLGRALYVL